MKRILSVMLCCLFVTLLCACQKFDDNYGKSSSKESTAADSVSKQIKIPEIKSDDSVMPTYIDISLYDEENYADIYLGENFEYKVTYAGSALSVPSSYANITKEGFKLADSEEYNEDSQILAGKSLTADFVNEYSKKITAVFYNNKKSSVSLKKCPIVKFIIKENELSNPDTVSFG